MELPQEVEESYSTVLQVRRAAKDLLKSATKYTESSTVCTEDLLNFCNSLSNIYNSTWVKQSPHIDVERYLRYFGTTLISINQAHTEMINDLTKGVVGTLQNYTSYDFLEVQNRKKKVHSLANDCEMTRGKLDSAQKAKKPVAGQIAQHERDLERLKKEQKESTDQFVTILEQTHQKKETKLLRAMYDMLEVHYDYHEKSFRLLSHLKSKMTTLEQQLQESSNEIKGKEGHLLQKATTTMTGGGWQKQWFVLKKGQLSSYKGKKDSASADQTLNIMYCTTRIPMVPKNNLLFEIVTPDKKKPLILQAETEAERDEWVAAIQLAIEEQLNMNEPAARAKTDQNDSLTFQILQAVDGNTCCADCSAPNPDWASINLGILVCLECSGVHRNLGVHITKVRSTTLDTKAWEPQLVYYMQQIGNTKFNQIYEASLDPSGKISAGADRPTREKFIRSKYDSKVFVRPANKSPEESAYDICLLVCEEDSTGRSIEILELIAQGAKLDWQNNNDGNKNLLHYAVLYDKMVYVELLIQNGLDIFGTDANGWTPMHYAAHYHRTSCACILYKHGFSGSQQIQCKDNQNKTAIEIAFNGQANDIVTLLSGDKNAQVGVGFTIEDLAGGHQTASHSVSSVAAPVGHTQSSNPPSPATGPPIPAKPLTTSSDSPPVIQRGDSLHSVMSQLAAQQKCRMSLPSKMQPIDTTSAAAAAAGVGPASARGSPAAGRGRGRGRGTAAPSPPARTSGPATPPKPSPRNEW